MLNTEKRNSKTTALDSLSTREILEIMNDEDFVVVEAVKRVIPQIEIVSKAMIDILNNAGRIIYAGAGTSGRLAVLDAVECGPTFSCKDEFVALMCGGNDALFKAVEGAEDNKELCVAD